MSAIERIMILYDSRVTSHGAGCIDLHDIFMKDIDRKVLEAPHLYSFAHIPQYLIEDVLDELPTLPYSDVDIEGEW